MKGMKRLLNGFFVVVMVLLGVGVNARMAHADECTMQSYMYNGYEVTFTVTSAWEYAFDAEVRIDNTGDEAINDWMFEFDFIHEILFIWDATVLEHVGRGYNEEKFENCHCRYSLFGDKFF